MEKIQIFFKTGQEHRLLLMKTNMFMILDRPFLLRMENVSNKSCRENQDTHFVFIYLFIYLYFENHTVYGIMWKNNIKLDKPQTIRCMRIACWIPKSTKTH